MQMYPGSGHTQYYHKVEEDYSFNDSNGSTMHKLMRPKEFLSQPNHSHNHSHGYPGYDQYSRQGPEGYNAKYTENWYEKEKDASCDDNWKQGRNDYSTHGVQYHNNANKFLSGVSHNVVMSDGYGPGHGSRVHMPEHCVRCPEEKRIWNFKGIED